MCLLWRLASGFLLQKSMFKPERVFVWFMMDELAPGWTFSWVSRFTSAQKAHYHNCVLPDLTSFLTGAFVGTTARRLTCKANSVVYWVTCRSEVDWDFYISSHKGLVISVLGENPWVQIWPSARCGMRGELRWLRAGVPNWPKGEVAVRS